MSSTTFQLVDLAIQKGDGVGDDAPRGPRLPTDLLRPLPRALDRIQGTCHLQAVYPKAEFLTRMIPSVPCANKLKVLG